MYCICRDWCEEYSYGGETSRYFTTEQLKTLYNTLQFDSGSEFAEFITGMNCDEYADKSCEYMVDEFNESALYDGECHFVNVFHHLDNCEYWLTCFTFYRCMNLFNLSDEEAKDNWLRDSKGTLEGMLESEYHNNKLEQGLQTLYWDEENDYTPELDELLQLYKKDNNLSVS